MLDILLRVPIDPDLSESILRPLLVNPESEGSTDL